MTGQPMVHWVVEILSARLRDFRFLCAAAALFAALSLVLAAVPPLAASEALGGIHITNGPNVGHISGSSVTITWTTNKAKAGLVKLGASAGHYGSTVNESAATTNHSVTLTGLTKATTYHYKVKTGSAASKDGTFTTANYSDAPFIFASMGDNRGHSTADDLVNVTAAFQNILNAAVAKQPAFTIHEGDLFYGSPQKSDADTLYSVFKAAIQPLATQAPFYISPGNHEMAAPCSASDFDLSADPEGACAPDYDPFQLFNQNFPTQPKNGPTGYVGTAFSFDCANTHVVSMDTCHYLVNSTNYDFDLYDLTDTEINWLDADLTQAQQRHVRHIFVYGHAEAYVPDGLVWNSPPSLPQLQTDLNGVIASPNVLVAVGPSGAIWTLPSSTTATSWTQRTSGTTAALRACAYGNSLLVVVGDAGTILTSPDGTTWIARTSNTTNNLYGIVFPDSSSDHTFVAVGASGTALTSSDGMTWTSVTSGTTQDLLAVTEAYVGSQHDYFAVGKAGAISISNGGTTWAVQTSGTTADLHGVSKGFSNGAVLIAAVGSAGTVLTSSDGTTWTAQTSGLTSALNAVCNNSNTFIAVGDGGKVLTSEDGVLWVSQNSHSTSNLAAISGGIDPNQLAEESYLAVGQGGAVLDSPAWLPPGHLGSYKAQRDRFWQVLTSHNVDAYICGHVHNTDPSTWVTGPVRQWLNGDSGSKSGLSRWTLWSINGDTATGQLLDQNGNPAGLPSDPTHPFTLTIQSSQP